LPFHFSIRLFFGFHSVATAETLDASGGIDKFLFTREKRMAFGADTDFDFLDRGFRFPLLTAGAGNNGVAVFRMYTFFHSTHLVFKDLNHYNKKSDRSNFDLKRFGPD